MQKINVYDHQSEAYNQAFRLFRQNSDVQEQVSQWLNELVANLPVRGLLVDAGAGYGSMTRLFAPSFERTIAIEPNAFLRESLSKTCPNVEVLPDKIIEAQIPPASADLVLCIHVFYDIPQEEWMDNLKKLVSCLSPNGMVVLILAHHASERMDLHWHFYSRRFDLDALAETFEEKMRPYDVTLEVIPGQVETEEFDSVYKISEFFLNPPPSPAETPAKDDLEKYINQHFAKNENDYTISYETNVLMIRRQV